MALGIAALSLLVAALPALAETPTRNPLQPTTGSGEGPVVPVVGPDVFAWFVAALVVAGSLAAVVGVGLLIARFGGPRRGPGTPGETLPSFGLAASAAGRVIQLSVAAFVVLVGLVAGQGIAAAAATGGLASISIGVIGVAVALGVAALVLPALVAWKARGRLSPAIATLIVAGGLLSIGTVAGSTFGAPPPVQVPVILEAAGTAQAALAGGTLPHTAKDDGTATCTSEPDGTLAGSVFIGDLGELGPGTLRGSVIISGADAAWVEIFIDGADIEGGEQPFWRGTVQVEAMDTLRKTGSVTVASLPRVEPAPGAGTPWPETLEGTVSWSCADWRQPEG